MRSALYETGELVRRLLAPPETLDIIRERLFGSPDVLNEFVAVRTEIGGAVGAQRMRIFYEPSSVLLRLMSALRAGQYEFLTLKCHGPPVPLSAMTMLLIIVAKLKRRNTGTNLGSKSYDLRQRDKPLQFRGDATTRECLWLAHCPFRACGTTCLQLAKADAASAAHPLVNQLA
jgi:hypothetical protein